MINFVPLDLYYPLFINTCLVLIAFTVVHILVTNIQSDQNVVFINSIGYAFLIILIAYIGLRPISNYFGDTVNYNTSFKKYVNGAEIGNVNDYGWHVFMKFMASITNVHIFLSLCCFLYIFPLYKISKVFFKEYWWYCFILFVVSFSFWAYGVNGVRNGAACSIFLWGFCYQKKPYLIILLFLLAIVFHKTLSLPILAFILTKFYNNPKLYLKLWLASIPISLLLGSIFIFIFASIGFGDDRLSGYLTSASGTSFRWDFLFHSAFAVFSGWYFVIKRKFNDPTYNQLLNIYLVCNSFWILVIKANFSNRFAYLSWFMMAIVVIYPILKGNFFKNQELVLAKVMFAYFLFTYLMSYIYYG